MPELRPAGSGDRDAIVALMTRAFHDDPGARIIEPDDALRDAAMTALFHEFVSAGLVEATAAHAVGSPPSGVAFWFGPAAYGPSAAALDAAAAEIGAPVMSDTALARFIPMVGELEVNHERLMGDEPHLRCDFLAVDPAAQRQGIGGRLVAAGSQLALELGLPIYLETFTTDNVRFYEHHGYRVLDDFPIPSTPHRAWAMRRDHRGAATSLGSLAARHPMRSGGLIVGDHDTGARRPRIDELERDAVVAVGEQSEPVTQDDREHKEPELIEEAVAQQRAHEGRAPTDGDVLSRLVP
jgi:GNAT superfamily N-acetyltransferase